MNRTKQAVSILALLALAGGASAAPYDTTGQAGRYDVTKAATKVRGNGGTFDSVKVWVPVILDRDDSSFNSPVAGLDGQGNPVGAFTTFTPTGINLATSIRVVGSFGTTDAAWPNAGPGGSSVNVFLSEGANNRSNSFGALTSDLTAVWRANFVSGVTNNLEYQTLPLNVNSPTPSSGTSKVFDPFAPGIDATAGGSVFLGAPGAAKHGVTLYTGATMFDGSTGVCPVGTAVYTGNNNNPLAPVGTWTQVGSPLPNGATADQVRQTQPALAVVTQCNGSGVPMVAFGVGFSGGSLSGGSARPQYIIVDRVDSGTYSNGFAFIDADGDNNLATTLNDRRFVSTQATGGGSGPFTGNQFSINAKGQVAVVWEDRTSFPFVYEVRVYDPMFDGQCNITGYSAPRVIARTGQDGIAPIVQNTIYVNNGGTGSVVSSTLVPVSGVGIDDDGNVAFTAVTEVFEETRTVTNPVGQPPATGMGPVLLNTTNTLFFYDAAGNSLHAVLKGGQSGDTLANVTSGQPAISMGFFPVDNATDSFMAQSISDTGKVMAVVFRSGGDENGVDLDGDGFADKGGILNPNTASERAVRGIALVKMGNATQTPCPGDANGDRMVNFLDLNIVLSFFGQTVTAGTNGDLDNNGVVNFLDLNIVLSFFGQNC
ncbi:MAG: dockerin type I domain-containing protein [Phycisphaerales bacterium]